MLRKVLIMCAAVLLVGSLVVAAWSRRESKLDQMETLARSVELPRGLRSLDVVSSENGCSGGCSFRTEFLCSEVEPRVAMSALIAAWKERSVFFNEFPTEPDLFVAEFEGIRLQIDGKPDRYSPASSSSTKSCPDSADRLVEVSMT